jgi:hypothetical protein
MYQQLQQSIYNRINKHDSKYYVVYFDSDTKYAPLFNSIHFVHKTFIYNSKIFLDKLVQILSTLESVSDNDCMICILDNSLMINLYDTNYIQCLLHQVQNHWSGLYLLKLKEDQDDSYFSNFFVFRKNMFSLFFLRKVIDSVLMNIQFNEAIPLFIKQFNLQLN